MTHLISNLIGFISIERRELLWCGEWWHKL